MILAGVTSRVKLEVILFLLLCDSFVSSYFLEFGNRCFVHVNGIRFGG